MLGKCYVRALLNTVVIIAILAMSFIYEVNKSRSYLKSVFDIFTSTLQQIGDNNVSDANYAQMMIEHGSKVKTSPSVISNADLHYFPSRNEYGFNQGVYPNVAANGMLIGYGKPPAILVENGNRFLAMDKIWNNYRKANKFHNHFVVNYEYQFVYSSNIRLLENREHFIKEGMIKPQRFRKGLEDRYIKDLEQYGFFFTLPYQNLLDDGKVFSVITPVYYQGEIFVDIGTDIELDELKTIIRLYPDLKKSIQVDLVFNGSDISVPVSEARYNSWDVFHYKYEVPNLGALVAYYDVLYFSTKLFPELCLLVMLSIIFHLVWSSLQRQKQEKLLLKEQLTHDSMTGLYNRRILDEQVIQEIDLLNKQNNPVCIIAIDANKFKKINDNYGHQIGDKAILHIADSLTTCTRCHDYCIRMGGDEFLIVLPNLPLEPAYKIAARLEKEVQERSIDSVGVEVTITSATTQMLPNETFDQVYKRVDELLYEKKG
ncbi:diguanylate cyclase [Vibrio algivorus]|uniref:diguanylate cyclase n=1 Tax=Vibrio algivorus TaxID=1667024 RepID=A0ABQ6ETW9_9VIBR|nr:diguanylate cyclase [Vibrio algivorus]GLT16196.1 hypothetical protein GCM10007931_31720 [Vibrio algivorus]